MALHVTMRVPVSIPAIMAAVEGLAALSFQEMHDASLGGDGFPSLYESGIVYRREPQGREDWQSASELLKSGAGDCEDLAAYRVGELRNEGEPAIVKVIQNPSGSYHAIVQRADGTLEDPSRKLIAIEAIGNRGDMTSARIRHRRTSKGHLGEIEMPMSHGGMVTVSELGWSPLDAIKKVVSTAASVARNPAVAPFLPPGVATAVNTASKLTQLATQNPTALKAIAPKLRPQARKLAKLFTRHIDHRPAYVAPQASVAPPAPQPQPQQAPYYNPYQAMYDQFQASMNPEDPSGQMEFEQAFVNDQYDMVDEGAAEYVDENGMPIEDAEAPFQ